GHGTILLVFFVLLAAAAAILGGVVAVVMGRGGEIALFTRDLPPVRLRLRNPSDVALLRFPASLLGYQVHATAQALHQIAILLAERDAEVARLRAEVVRLGGPAGSASGQGSRSSAAADGPVDAEKPANPEKSADPEEPAD